MYRKKIYKAIFLAAVLALLIAVIPLTFSKYESKVGVKAQPKIAFYLLKTNYIEKNMALSKITPSNIPSVYTFTISNNDGKNRLETKLQYDLSIVTTTNLPLTYELYLNENYSDLNAKNIIATDKTEPDKYGTFFKTLTTDTITFDYTKDITNTYNLVVYFPETYKGYKYQDILENISININSKQIIKGE